MPQKKKSKLYSSKKGSRGNTIKNNNPNVSPPVDAETMSVSSISTVCFSPVHYNDEISLTVVDEVLATQSDVGSSQVQKLPEILPKDIDVQTKMRNFVRGISRKDLADAGSSSAICLDEPNRVVPTASRKTKKNILYKAIPNTCRPANANLILVPSITTQCDDDELVLPKKYPKCINDKEVKAKIQNFVRGISRQDAADAGGSNAFSFHGQTEISPPPPKRCKADVVYDIDVQANVQTTNKVIVPSIVVAQDAIVENRNVVLLPREPVFTLDDLSEGEENIVVEPLPVADEVRELLEILGNELEQERLHQMEEARARAEQEELLLQEVIEQQRDRPNQIPTYLLATEFDDTVQKHNLGPFNEVCQYCYAICFVAEKNTRGVYTHCCSNGAVVLPPLNVMPPLLRRLYTGDHHLSRHFRQNIIKYNYLFQFASVEANVRQFANRGPYVFAIQGKIYHHVSHMDINNPQPRYAQMYFLNPEDGVARRHVAFGEDLDRQLIADIDTLVREVNPYAVGLSNLRERYEAEREIQNAQNEEFPNLILEFIHVGGRDNRNFEAPAVNEVAIVFNADNELLPSKNMRIYLRDRPHRFIEIHAENPLSDPLSFPLLFPLGEQGWHINMYRTNNRAKLTLVDYYSYKFSYRFRANEQFQIFQHSGKLFQQFVVASYIKIESNRMTYIVNNQQKLRTEVYNGLADYVRNQANQNDINIGRMVILPSTFIGSPRHMIQLFQDSLAVVQELGQPSLFITFTCNPKWKEIVDNIPANDEANNHPLMVARVFKCMLKKLLDELENDQVMGVCIGRLYVIEFQKRGLPHAHILLTLRPQDRMEDAYRIDSLIRAELPDVETEPELYNVICTNNIHGPCEQNSICMKDGKCSKGFPKQFVEETLIDEKGFVKYRRRDDGRIAIINRNGRQIRVNNRWVVPYNPYLTLRFRAHINVEACTSVRAIKYLHKYVWKGADQCIMQLRDENEARYDEVHTYVTARYLAPPEASWRILKFSMHENTHAVVRLPVHLPQEQMVRFDMENPQGALDHYEHTHLTRWFELNSYEPDARQFLYPEIPKHYVWKDNVRNWSPRQRLHDKIISRMYSVSVRQGELYYLRLLLLHVRGAQGWEELRTVDGQVCANFREACSRLHLLQDDREWTRCLTEAEQTHMPYQIRHMYACILVFCEVTGPVDLWERFADAMSEDFIRANANVTRDAALQMALIDIQRVLSVHNKRLAEYGLPQPNINLIHEEPIDVDMERDIGLTNRNRLNDNQREIFDVVLRALHNNQNAILPPHERLFVIDSPGGTGKSFLFNTLISTLAGENIGTVACCFSGIGATVLKRGRTIHSTFKLKLCIDETTTSGIRPNTQEGRYIAGAQLIIIDEISMVPKLILSIIDKTLKDVTRNDVPFGGKVILLGGDFRQLLPVVEHANRATIVSHCAKNSVHWPLFSRYVLNINVRALIGEARFCEWVLELGNNTLPTFTKYSTRNLVAMPATCIVETKQRLIDICFHGIRAGDCRNVAILTPKNDHCEVINEEVLNMIDGELKVYISADSLDEQDEDVMAANYTVEYLNTLRPSGFPSHRLCLKVGAVVLLLRNLNVRKNLCNGTKLLIRELHNNYITAERLESGNPTGEIVFIPRIDFNTTGTNFPIAFKRRQYPLRLAYSMTINKSQGQTMDIVGIYLPQPVFSHGALYVAASRARSFDRLHIFVENTNEQGTIAGRIGIYTKNIVYNEVLV